ncbi:hypothetical protein J3R83DRAFT_9163 [Lanmaoa asiatica]|nr:hypothetical protein J3R83DRAFT_9163 [Lanmaoa asiatica]
MLAFLLNTLMVPGYFACISATILVLHVFTHLLIARTRHLVVIRQSPFAAFEVADVSVANSAVLRERTFVELHGGLVSYLFKIARLFSCMAFLALCLATFQTDRCGECLFSVSAKDDTAYSCPSSSLRTPILDRIQFSLCATSAFAVFLSVITVASPTGVGRLVSAHLTIVLLATLTVYAYRDVWPLLTFTEQPVDSCEGPLLWGKLATLTVGAVVYPLFSPRLYIPLDLKKPSDTPHPEQTASWASLLFYSWVEPTVWLACRLVHLPHDLLPPLSDQDCAENLKRHSFPHLDQFSGAKKCHIFYGLMTVFRTTPRILSIILLTCGNFRQALASLIAPLGLKYLLHYLETGGEDALVRPWAWILLILLGTLISSLAYQWYNFIEASIMMFDQCRTMVRAEAILSQLIFEHALRIRVKAETEDAEMPASQGFSEPGASGQASKDAPSTVKSSAKNLVGKLNNLVTSDLATANDGRDFLILGQPFPSSGGLIIHNLQVSHSLSALVGLVVMLITSPLPGMVMKRIQHVKREQSKKKRHVNNGALTAIGVIRMVKLFGWESQTEQRIFGKREDELAWLWKFKILELINANMNNTRTTRHDGLIVYQAFDLLRNQLRSIFFYLPKIVSARVSLDRINEFLLDTELLDRYEPGTRNALPIPTTIIEELDLIGFRDATFAWSQNGVGDGALMPPRRSFTLKVKGEVYFQRGCVNLIIGPTGSGKTSMLMALLGEMHWMPSGPGSWFNLPRDGGVAYAAQESWVQNDTIKNNILFGAPYDDDRYKQVLYQCALEKDLGLFEAGDDTEVGEKGLTLSGGQKARITLARAIYSSAEIILLDDILAALDVHTASWIVNKCFAGDVVHGRTVILVTHNIAVVRPITQFVVSLASNGHIIDQGSFSDLVERDEALAAVFAKEQEILEKDGVDEVPEVNGEKPNGNGKLVMAEEIPVGHVSWAAFKLYLAALGGVHTVSFWAVVLALFVITNLANTLQTWFLGYWATQYEDHLASEVNISFYLSGYTLLLFFGTSTWSLAYYVFYLGTMRASRAIHNRVTAALLGTTFRFPSSFFPWEFVLRILRWLDTTPASRIIARCTQDIRASKFHCPRSVSSILISHLPVDGPLPTGLAWVLELSMKMFFSLGAVVVITPAFLLPGVIVGVVGAWVGRVYMKAQLSVKREMSNAKSPVLGHLGAAMAGLTSIRAYGAEEVVIRESLARIDKYTRAARMFYNLNRWMSVRVDALGTLFAAALATYLVYGPETQRAANIGFSLNMAVMFSSLILWWVRFLNDVEVHGNLERVDSYIKIEQEPKPTDLGMPPAYWPASGDLRVENLSARYSPDGPEVLHGLSFHIKSGERVGISSLTLSLLRCIFTEGQIYLDGVLTSKINLDALRSHVTVIPQIPELLSGTLRRNLDPFEEHDDATLNDVLRSAGLFAVQESSEESRLTLDSLISGGGSNLSVGQRQILALARAMVRRSKLLILDEGKFTVDMLDYRTDATIQSSLRNGLSGATQLIVAHRLQTIMDADRIMILDAGKIHIMILALSSESVRNTVFKDENGLPLYKSDTPFRLLGARTTVICRHTTRTSNNSEMDGPVEVVGCITWHCFGPSIFTIGGRELESNVFLPSHGFFGRKRTFTGPDGRQYRWDMHSRDVVVGANVWFRLDRVISFVVSQLSLDDASRTEIVRYHRGTCGIIRRGRSAYLEIAPQAEHMLDLVILTFIYVEKLRMDKEASRRMAATSGGGP